MSYKSQAVILMVIVAAIIGCSENLSLKARYQAEKLFFEAEKAYDESQIRPDLASAESLALLKQNYRTTLEFCYQSLANISDGQHPTERHELGEIAFRATTRLSVMFFTDRQFDSSIALMDNLIQTVPLTGRSNISAYLNLGRTLQAAGSWDSALSVFNYAVETFYPPATPDGEIVVNLFNLPTHIIDIHVRTGDSLAAIAQVEKSEAYYRRLIADYPGGNLSGASHLSLASMYERLGRYEEAVVEFGYLTDSAGNLAAPAGMRIASIHAAQLNQPDLAIEQYDRILAGLTGPDTLARPRILFDKALVHLYRSEHDLARQILLGLKRDYPGFFNRTPTVQFAIARALELQDKWDRAETEYRFLISNFPSSEQSLSTYLYLIDKYKEAGLDVEAARMEARAKVAYNELIRTRPGTQAEAAGLSYKAELARRNQNWTEALALLSEAFNKFPSTEAGFRAAISAALIYRDDLNDQIRADSVIEELKKKLTTIDEERQF